MIEGGSAFGVCYGLGKSVLGGKKIEVAFCLEVKSRTVVVWERARWQRG